MKLPTTFQELDLTGFDIETKQYNSITKSMVSPFFEILVDTGYSFFIFNSLWVSIITINSFNNSTDVLFKDSTLKLGDSMQLDGFRITVVESGDFGDVVKVEKIN